MNIILILTENLLLPSNNNSDSNIENDYARVFFNLKSDSI
jgi:hypothetical protein